MKLLKVSTKVEFVLAVEDDADHVDQINDAARVFRDVCSDLSSYDMDYEFEPYAEVGCSGWDDSCYPYRAHSDDEELKIGQIMKQNGEVLKRDPNSVDYSQYTITFSVEPGENINEILDFDKLKDRIRVMGWGRF